MDTLYFTPSKKVTFSCCHCNELEWKISIFSFKPKTLAILLILLGPCITTIYRVCAPQQRGYGHVFWLQINGSKLNIAGTFE